MMDAAEKSIGKNENKESFFTKKNTPITASFNMKLNEAIAA